MAKKQVPPWDYELSGGAECLLCGCRARPTVVGARPELGVCEACSVHLHHVWRGLPLDADPAPPDESRLSAGGVRVLLCRLASLPGGGSPDPEAPESYEVALAEQGGVLDLPRADASPGEPLAAASLRALADRGISSWEPFLEPLYSALAPRGRLCQVVLATAYTEWAVGPGGASRAGAVDSLLWRPWPPWEQARELGALYLPLREVWRLRLWKHRAQERGPSQVSTCLRRAAAEHVYIRQQVRSGAAGVDDSLLPFLRRSMSDDEVLVDRLLAEHEERLAESREQDRAGRESGEDSPEAPEESPGDLPDEVALDEEEGES